MLFKSACMVLPVQLYSLYFMYEHISCPVSSNPILPRLYTCLLPFFCTNVQLKCTSIEVYFFTCVQLSCKSMQYNLYNSCQTKHGRLLLFNCGCTVIVKTLGTQHLRQLALLSRALFQLGPLVLEPDFDLALVQTKLLKK